jgi:triosephosphate isomerase
MIGHEAVGGDGTIAHMKSILVANWKMNPATFKEAKSLFDATRKALEKTKSVSLIIAPPTIFLRDLTRHYGGRRIQFALQHVSAEMGGAFTGEVSLPQGKDAKISHCIIAHAERRAMGETNDDARRKIVAALAQKITPILCIGEATRDASGTYFNLIKEQLRIALLDIPAQKLNQILIAYEPVWAIGAAKPMDARSMHEMSIFIHKCLTESHGKEGMNVKILYGGAVDDSNVLSMLREGEVQGFLVGRASVDPTKVSALIRSLATA